MDQCRTTATDVSREGREGRKEVFFLAAFAAFACFVATAACSKPSRPPPAATAPSSGASQTNTVVGKAPPPAPGESVLVVLEPRTERTFPPQTEPPVMDQAGLAFGPELLLVRTGQPVEFRNSDDTLHNVHVSHEETREPAFNVAIPTGGSYSYTFARGGFYRVGCDIHPAMAASVFAASTPFAALAATDGGFTFSDVPAGAWHLIVYAAGRHIERDIEVKPGTTAVTVQ
jgi:plastocyanin